MSETWSSRTERLLGPQALDKLRESTFVVYGVGGVGGAACEALVRTGVGKLRIIDGDTIAPSNLNRQLITDQSNLATSKVQAALARFQNIRSDIKLEAYPDWITADSDLTHHLQGASCVLDCIDTVSAKLHIIETCIRNGQKIYSAMGAGNRLDPTQIQISDLAKTYECALARVMRRELKKRGILHLPVVFSPEHPRKPKLQPDEKTEGKIAPGSLFFPPVISGTLLAYEAIRTYLGPLWPSDDN